MQKDEGSLDVLSVYARRYFPGRPLDTDCLAEAAFLEWDYWKKMANLLNKALGG